MGRKWRGQIGMGSAPFWGGEAGYPSNTKSPVPPFGGRGVPIYHKIVWAEAYLHTKWHLDPWIHLAGTDMSRKLGGTVSLWGEGSWVPI